MTYDGFRNRYNFVKDRRTVMLVLLTLKEVYEDKMKMREKEGEHKKVRQRVLKGKRKRVRQKVRKKEKSEKNGRVKKNFFERVGEIRKV